MRPAALAGAALVGAGLVLLSGCGVRAGGSPLTAVDGCATVLPLAARQFRVPAQLVSVHALRRGDPAHYLRELGAATPAPTATGSHPSAGPGRAPKACVVVYRGTFTPADLTGPVTGARGTYGVVFLDTRHPQVRRVVLVGRLPADLGD